MKNYESERLEIEQQLPLGTPLLLHSCCAPCSTSVIERLAQRFKLTIFFYNPNIDTEDEYQRRLSEQRRLLSERFADINVIEEGYWGNRFLQQAEGLETLPEGGARCEICFKLRFDALACRARKEQIDWIASTLSVSPMKSVELVNREGQKAAKTQEVNWLPADFKKKNGYLRSIEMSRECGLYRQNYCGCRFSKIAAELKQK